MYVVAGKKNCLKLKKKIANTKGNKKKMYGFFLKNRKTIGNCAPVIGYEGIKGVIKALKPSCGKPLRTDKKNYAFFYCKPHGDRREFFFKDAQVCRRSLKSVQKKLQ